MASHDKPQTALSSSPGRASGASPTTLRVGSLSAGALGLMGFALAIFAGLAADNPISQVLYRAIITLVIMAVIGGVAGAMAGRVIHEQILNRAKLIQEQQAQALVAASAAAARQASQSASKTGQQGTDGQPGVTGKIM
jgi:tetrahydromethanopterin S-methyltransferase subunit C